MDSTNRENLRNILSVAQKSKALLASYRRQAQPSCSSIPNSCPATLNLPYPDDLAQAIQGKRLPVHVALAISQKVHDWINNVQSLHLNNFKQLCVKLMVDAPQTSVGPMIKRLASVYEHSYSSQYVPWIRSTLFRYLSSVPNEDNTEQRRPHFNTKYTPVLEKYFQLNAYPCAAERRALAQKSGMSTRQIEVWFQNHRNRSKKDGLNLVRRHSGLSRICLEQLEQEVLGCPSPALLDGEESDEDDCVHDEPSSPVLQPQHPFSDSSPPHAFPTRYSAQSLYDPFPSTLTFSTPQWPRQSSASKVKNADPIDVDELTSLFASKLSFRAQASRSSKQNCNHQSSQHQHWFTATVTIAPSAPHPAFVKPPPSCASPQSPRRFSPFPLSLAGSPSRRSQKPRLPKRLPDWSRLASPPSSRPSRTPSLESISSCDSSSSGSSVEELVTPPLTPLQGPDLLFNDFFDNPLHFEFANLPSPPMSFGLDASNKTQGGFPPMFAPFQYVTSS